MQRTRPDRLAGRYCIVGAGAAGLGAAEVLNRRGAEVDVFERSDRVGGHWHDDYESLHLITSRDASGFPGFAMPSSYPAFPSRDQVRDYLVEFARAHGLPRLVRFDSEVSAVTDNEDGTWTVRCGHEDAGVYDGVIVANGHLWSARIPEIADAFCGTSMHSSAYRNLGDIDGERVLVVGAGNSGCDLAVEAAQARFETTISMRHGQAFLPKTIFGTARAELDRINALPRVLRERVLRQLVKIVLGDNDRYEGLPPPVQTSLDDQPPVVNNLLLYWIQHGRVRVAPGISEIRGTKVTFTDGRTDEFDTVLWATGFDVRLPFVADDHLEWRHGTPARLGGLTVPAPHGGTSHDGLYFVGLAAPRGPQWPVYTRQAELVHRFLSLRERGMTDIPQRLDRIQDRNHRVDIVRSIWESEMTATERLVTRWERKLGTRGVGKRDTDVTKAGRP